MERVTRRLATLVAIVAIAACGSEGNTPSKSPVSPPVPYSAKPTIIDIGNGKRHYIAARLNADIVVRTVDTVQVEVRKDGKCAYGAIKYRPVPRGRAAVVQETDDSTCMAVVYYVTIPDRGLRPTKSETVSQTRDVQR